MLLAAAIVLILILILAYLSFGLLIYSRQERILFHPSKDMLCDPASAGLPFEKCSIKSAGGPQLEAWFIPAKEKPRRTILFCIGNAGNISHYLETASVFHKLDCELLLFNYRDYGNSEGPFPSEEGICLDAVAAWDYLAKERGIPEERIVPVGRSLGGGVACELASRRKARALILESTFKSVPAMAAELYPLYPANLLAKIKFDNLSKVASLDCPTLIIHSIEDEIIPYRHGKTLFKASAGKPKSFMSLSGPHNDCYFVTQSSYEEALKGFLNSLPK